MISLPLLLSLTLCSLGTAATVVAQGGNGEFDLTANGMNSAGIGFTFRDSDSMQKSKQFFQKNLPKCSIGPLDAVYFYLYGCYVPSEVVVEMAEYVGDGFSFTSDKSITIVTNISSASLLLANAWDVSLDYSSEELCLEEYDTIKSSDGCVATSECGKKDTSVEGRKGNSVTVGCGSLSCTGCVLTDFFTKYVFEKATFLMN
jgi:hypothetical protein